MGTGGSRYGAGRPGWRRKCEHLLRLDVRVLDSRGHLRPGMYFSWHWSRDGEPCGTIGVRVAEDHLRLIYTRTPSGDDPQSFDYPVWVERTSCRYGGSRPWFQCPRCQSRRALLYGTASDGRFGCRQCMRLAYASEADDTCGRLWRKQRRLEAKLAEGGQRPKWMRARTFSSIRHRIIAVEEAKDREFMIGAARLLFRLGMNLNEPL